MVKRINNAVILLRVKEQEKEVLEKKAAKQDLSLNQLLRGMIRAELRNDKDEIYQNK